MGKDKEHDCAVDILKTARGAWQKNVGESLVNLEAEIKWMKKEVAAAMGLVLLILAVVVKLAIGG